MQDNRNGPDANYKTYGTPLAIPYPMDAHTGQTFHQAVRVSVAGAPPRPARRAETLRVELGDSLGRTLPPLGVGMASHGGPLSAHEAGLLRRLQLDHVRVDVHLQDPSHPDALQCAVVAAQALDARLELALFVADGADDQLTQFASLLQAARLPLARIV